jgi:hypothetical protein
VCRHSPTAPSAALASLSRCDCVRAEPACRPVRSPPWIARSHRRRPLRLCRRATAGATAAASEGTACSSALPTLGNTMCRENVLRGSFERFECCAGHERARSSVRGRPVSAHEPHPLAVVEKTHKWPAEAVAFALLCLCSQGLLCHLGQIHRHFCVVDSRLPRPKAVR